MKNIPLIFNTKFLVLLLFFFSFSNFSAQSIDTDGDGILNQYDLDDDNDGIPDKAECTIIPDDLVTWWNDDNVFSPEVYTTILSAQNSGAGTGLTRVRNPTNNFQQISQVNATSEASSISNNEYVEYSVTIKSRYVAVTQIKYYSTDTAVLAPYTFTLRISSDNFATSTLVHSAYNYTATGSDFTVNTTQPLYLSPYTTYKFRVYFYNVNGGSSGTIAHDDFTLRGDLECDVDGDLIPNRLDLDSDGDGCPDAIEGDENVSATYLNSDGSINYAVNGGIGTSTSNNGVPNLVNYGGAADIGGDVGQGIGTSQNALTKDPLCCNAGIAAPNLNNSTAYSSSLATYTISCGSTTADLSTLTASNKPSGCVITWHTGPIATNANRVNPANAIAGTAKLYAAFYYTSSNCYSPTKMITVVAPICAVDDDYSVTPIIAGVGGTLPSIFSNDTYNGTIISTMPANSVDFFYELWTPANATVDGNGNLTIPSSTPIGNYTYLYKICDKDPDVSTGASCSVAQVTFKVVAPQPGCYKPATPTTSGTTLISKVGISSLNRPSSSNDNWPAVRKGGWLVLESRTKGFVPNRIAFDATGNPIGIAPANFVEGMMVYDTTNKCLKVYTSTDGGATFGWKCMTTQTCPD